MKVVSLNCENLFISLPEATSKSAISQLDESKWQQLGRGPNKNKSLAHLKGLAEALLKIDADFICLSEVGGEKSLNFFNQLFLDSTYISTYIAGNSDRGIGMAILKKSTLPLKLHIESNAHISLPFELPAEKQSKDFGLQVSPHKVARDLPEVYVHSSDDRVLCVLIPLHLKSKRDPWGLDPSGRDQRNAELGLLIKIYNRLKNRYPVIICGDFNGRLEPSNEDSEFNQIFQKTDLVELLNYLNFPEKERWTFFSRSSPVPAIGIPLDSFLVSPNLLHSIDKEQSCVYQYRAGSFPPQSKIDLLNMPSDHCPVILQLSDDFLQANSQR